MWQTWDRLPRDTRDTLFQLAVIGWTILPHLGHLAPWCGVMALSVLLWRGWLAWRAASLPPRWNVALVLALAIGLTLWSEGTLLGRQAGVTQRAGDDLRAAVVSIEPGFCNKHTDLLIGHRSSARVDEMIILWRRWTKICEKISARFVMSLKFTALLQRQDEE